MRRMLFLSTIFFKGVVLMTLIGALGSLVGCRTAQIEDYQDEQPKLVLEDYLNGKLEAYGFFQDRSGLIVQRFKVIMDASWDKSGKGVLKEDFVYSDGKTSQRIWHLQKNENGKFTGRADDVVGEASGRVSGNAFHWEYTLRLPYGKSTVDVYLDDWMYYMGEGVMLNKSKMSKLGIYLGEVTITFIKKSESNFQEKP